LRRTSDEIKGLLRAAAADFFASNGYAGTSTRAIATEAGVSETLLFRHFGTKSGLFEATTLDKFRVSVEDYLSRWSGREVPPGGEQEHATAFLAGLLAFFRKQRGVMFALMTVDAAQDDDIGSIQATAQELFDRLMVAVRENVLTRADGQLYPGLDREFSAPGVTSALLCVTLLDSWLFRDGTCQPPLTEIDDEVIAYVLDGVGHRATAS
jgi:AcrR family transcriptional regulator